MPVSKSKRRDKNRSARHRQETKRLNVIRGKVGNMSLSPADAKIWTQALKEKTTPLQYLAGVRKDIDDLLQHFNLITDTRDRFNEHEDFNKAFLATWPELHARVIDCADAIDEYRKTNQAIHDEHYEDMESLGNVQLTENWAACIGPLQAYDTLQSSIEGATVDGFAACIRDLIKSTAEASQYAEVNMVGTP